MFGIIKKLSIAALFIGYTLLPMDLPVETPTAPLSIIALLDKNIEYFTNALKPLDVILQTPAIENTLQQKTQNKRLHIQHLLELNQSCKQQRQDFLSQSTDDFMNQLQKDNARKEEEFSKHQDQFNTEIAKARPTYLLENHQKKVDEDVNKMLKESDQRIHATLTTTTVPTTSHNATATTERTTISPEDHTKKDVLQKMNEIVTITQKALQAVNNKYLPDIENKRQQIEALKKEKAILEKKHTQLNRFGYCMCAGIFALIISTVYITKYLCPQ